MKISEAIERLTAISKEFGDLYITGGYMHDDSPLNTICVTDTESMMIFPEDPNGVRGKNEIDGVFLSS